jgi:hypothetical protein
MIYQADLMHAIETIARMVNLVSYEDGISVADFHEQ